MESEVPPLGRLVFESNTERRGLLARPEFDELKGFGPRTVARALNPLLQYEGDFPFSRILLGKDRKGRFENWRSTLASCIASRMQAASEAGKDNARPSVGNHVTAGGQSQHVGFDPPVTLRSQICFVLILQAFLCYLTCFSRLSTKIHFNGFSY
jgi:hypothetical protein